MKKITRILTAFLLLFAFMGCASGVYTQEMKKNAAKNRSEQSADKNMKELDRETK